ncbi:conserved hypothetical protein [Tenacibaculum dicentrarchi]|uniref:Metallo-beta-lactamase superfamily protein n=1 Tax=Tenacibaculum dicentrarchi TaxID=669041 RepID=A0ABM9NY08_9FLAO|nr:conserved hypothetical protein [Tenacibaculum dicentrarchi]
MNSLEIDFLPVGNGEKSGDAIAFRYGNFSNPSEQKVIIIDGGTKESGKELCKLIKETYKTYIIDIVICTHPDGDHASGLREVLGDEELTIKSLIIHKPWEHSKEIKDLFHDGRITSNSLSERLKEAYNFAYECVEIAERRGIKIYEPFSGLSYDNKIIRVLGPDKNYYLSLLPDFAKSPKAKETSLQKSFSAVKEAVNWVRESMQIETLSEDGETSAENNSSAVVLLELDGDKYLFTGDTGIPALKRIIDYCNNKGIDISNVKFMQVPHHGSKRNISPSILNSIKCKTAYVSASKDAPKHPAKKVINAYIRRGAKVYTTEGTGLNHHINTNTRIGWSSATPKPFSENVED